MKRKNIIVISAITLTVLILVGNFYTRKYAVLHADPVDAIPPDAAFFVEVKNGMTGAQKLLQAPFFSSLCKDSSFSRLKNNIRLLDSLLQESEIPNSIRQNQIVYISAHPTKADEFDFLFMTNIPRGETERAVVSSIIDIAGDEFEENVREYEDVKLHELIRNQNIEFIFSVTSGIVMISRTPFLVEDAIRQLKAGTSIKKAKTFTRINKRVAKDEYAALFLNSFAIHDMLSAYIDPSQTGIQTGLTDFLRWSRLSISPENQGIRFDGNSIAADTTNFLAFFRGQKPIESRIAAYAPARAALVASFTSDRLNQALMHLRSNTGFSIGPDFSFEIVDSLSRKFKTNLDKHMQWASDEFALVVTEPASTSLENNLYAYVKSRKISEALAQLQELQIASKGKSSEKYRQHTVGNINIPALAPLYFGKMFIDLQNTWYTNVNDYIVFANSNSGLKNLIDDIEEKRTLDKESDFKRNTNSTSFSGNINFYFSMKRGENILRSFSNENISSMITGEGIFQKTIQSLSASIQCTNEICPTKLHIDFSSDHKSEVHLLWSAQLDTTISTAPCVINTGTNEYLAVQDARNDLYLFDESGKTLWKKNIGAPILSTIHAIDQYHNGESQLVFNTSERLFMIDINGDSVNNFPVKLPVSTTSSCIIAHTGSQSSDQIFIWCGNGIIYAYESSGKPVNSWLFNQFISELQTPPMPFTFNKQLHFLLTTGNSAAICDSKGKMSPIKGVDFSFTKSEILYSDSGKTVRFVFISDDGSMQMVNASAPSVKLPVMQNYSVSDLVSLSSNVSGDNLIISRNDSLLKISDDLQTEDFLLFKKGLSTYQLKKAINKTDKIAMTDTLATQFYLLTSDGTPEEGFPVKGCSDFSVTMDDELSGSGKIFISDNQQTIFVYGL